MGKVPFFKERFSSVLALAFAAACEHRFRGAVVAGVNVDVGRGNGAMGVAHEIVVDDGCGVAFGSQRDRRLIHLEV